MVARMSASRSRRLIDFGDHLRTWRKASRLTAELVAERAGVTRDTLRAIENGTGTVKLENVFAVMEALGLDSLVTSAVDPAANDRGRVLLQRGLPERVRV